MSDDTDAYDAMVAEMQRRQGEVEPEPEETAAATATTEDLEEEEELRHETFDATFDNFKIRKNNRRNAPEAVITSKEKQQASKLVKDIVRETEQYRLKRIAHIATRRRSTTPDRIKAIVLLMDALEGLEPATAVKIINQANALVSNRAVADADKVKIATALRKQILKPAKQKGPLTFEELRIQKDGQYVIQIDDE